MRSQVWINSEETDDPSNSRSIFSINTATYSVHRTAQHISLRLDDASKRLQFVSSTIEKKKSQKQNTTQNQQLLNEPSTSHLVQVISELVEENQKKANKIQQLEDKIIELENGQLRQEQQFLLEESKYIEEINELNKLYEKRQGQEEKWKKEKLELVNKIDELGRSLHQKETEIQKIKSQQTQTLKRQRDEVWRWSSMLGRSEKVMETREQLQERLQDLNMMINGQGGLANKENVSLNGIIPEAMLREKRERDSGGRDDSLYRCLMMQAECIQQLAY